MSKIESKTVFNRDNNYRVNKANQSGFTLIEMLVVIAIITLLAGLLTVGVSIAQKKATRDACQATMQGFEQSLNSYEIRYGLYPPTDIGREYRVAGNNLNTGIESFLAHMVRNKNGLQFEYKEEWLENTDGDTLENADLLEELNWVFGNKNLMEIVDPWGNPLIYICADDYGPSFSIQTFEEKVVKVEAVTSPKTSTYYNPNRYQFRSLGPNGEDDQGEEDDIVSW